MQAAILCCPIPSATCSTLLYFEDFCRSTWRRLLKRRVQARHTEASAISTPESNSNAQNVSETSELPQKRPPLLLILHNVLQPAPLRFGQWQLDCR